MLNVYKTTKFEKDVKRIAKQSKNMSLLKSAMSDIENEIKLDKKYKEHFLTGDYDGRKECHIQPDWILIYLTTETEVYFERTGSHSELF